MIQSAALLLVLAGASGFLRAPRERSARLGEKPGTFDTKEARFSLKYGGEVSAYRELSAFVLPGTMLHVEVTGPSADYTFKAESAVAPPGTRAWQWRAPQTPGVYDLRVEGAAPSAKSAPRDAITLHVFVMVPASEVRNGFLNGYRIGSYPAKPPGGQVMYQAPKGFVEVTKDNQDVHISPHFRLKQFLCKQETSRSFPQYLVLKERLVLELEAILERINRLGIHVDTLHVMSAYRTPYYNHAIGDVPYSQHQWGSAADIYIDKNNTNRMDDINHDGQIDVADSRYLSSIIEQMLAAPAYGRFQGGIGFYPGTPAHPPFVHVDVRGLKARWRG